ncbi:nuclease-related domain-containing protein [Halalkalibacillus sediminis]|uniref:nuclease-related domain-containing protein n=1 Tax=Halalkalibacillus sediminis TaxID=2018042 RepID=UPI001390252D|nr:nuclease-related domain-containing protein [Halalkalibacillus sediminis]
MKIREHHPPKKLLQALSLEERFPTHHPLYPLILKTLRREKSGFSGEKKIDFYLHRLQFPYVGLHSVRLAQNQVHFQVDTLMITPTFITLVEIKNHSGTIRFHSGKMHQDYNGTTESYDDPITQVNEQKELLRAWLDERGYTDYPLETLVVMGNSNSHLQIDPSQIHHLDRVIPINLFNEKMRELNEKYDRKRILLSECHRLGKLIDSHCVMNETCLLEALSIPPSQIIKGVRCPECNRISMKRIKLRWECSFCKARTHTAQINTFKDMYLLYGPTFNNKSVCEFFDIDSNDFAYYLIKSMNFKKLGRGKGSIYHMRFDRTKEFTYLLK